MDRYLQTILNLLNTLPTSDLSQARNLRDTIESVASGVPTTIRDSTPDSVKRDLKNYFRTSLRRRLTTYGINYPQELFENLDRLTDNVPDSSFATAQRQARTGRTLKNYLIDNPNVLNGIVETMQTQVAEFMSSKGLSPLSPAQKGAMTRAIKQKINALGVSRELGNVNDIDFAVASFYTSLPDVAFRKIREYSYIPWDEVQPFREDFQNRFSESSFLSFKETASAYVNEIQAAPLDNTDAAIKTEYIDNITDDKLKTIRQKAFDLYQNLDEPLKAEINLNVLLDNIRIEPSMLYDDKIVFYYNTKLTNQLSTGDTPKDYINITNNLLTELKTTVAENNSVFQIEISHEVETTLGENGRHSTEGPGRGAIKNKYGDSNKVGKINITQIYYPEENNLVLNKFAEWFDSKLELLDSQLDTDSKLINIINSDGPRFVSNPNKIKDFSNIILSTIRNFPELQYILDTGYSSEILNNTRTTPFKWEIIGSNKSGGKLTEVKEIHKEGLGQWFRDILRMDETNKTDILNKHPKWKDVETWLTSNYSGESLVNNKFAILDEQPSWVYGLVHTGPDGKKRIISIALSDASGSNNYSNGLGYEVRNKTSSITTNFISWKPMTRTGEQIVYGYYPSLVETIVDRRGNPISMNKLLKSEAVRVAQYWFGGMLAVADNNGVICDCSPINPQVFNIYQRGGFIADSLNNLTLSDTPIPASSPDSSLVRIPGNYKIVDPDNYFSEATGWSILPPLGDIEFEFDTIEATVWDRPDVIRGTAKRRYFEPGQVESSPRHKAILSLSQFDVSKIPAGERIRTLAKVNAQMLKLAGINITDTTYADDFLVNRMSDALDSDSVNDLKYVFTKKGNLNKQMILGQLSNKKLGELLFNSTLLEKITGIDTNLIDDVTKNSASILFDTSYKVDTGTTEPDGDYVKIKRNDIAIRDNILDSLSIEDRQDLGIFTKEEVLESINTGLSDADQITELTPEFWKNWYYGTLAQTELPHSENTLGYFTSNRPTPTQSPDDIAGQVVAATSGQQQRDFIFDRQTFNRLYTASPNGIGFEIRAALRNTTGVPSRVINTGALVDAYHWTDVDETATSTFSQLASGRRMSERQKTLQKVNLIERLNPYSTNANAFMERISPRVAHRYVQLLNELSKRDGSILLTADIEYVGHHTVNNKAIDYFEIGTVKQTTTASGEIKLVKNYMTIAVDFNDLNTSGMSDGTIGKILSVQQIHRETDVIMGTDDLVANRTFQAFNMLLNDLGIETRGYRTPTRNTLETQVHPVGRIGRDMGVISRDYGNTPTLHYGEISFDTQLEATVKTLNNYDNDPLMKNEISALTQQSKNEKPVQGQITPQPLYSTINILSDLSSAKTYNQAIEELFDLVDNKTTGAVAMEFKISSTDGTYTLGTLIKRHGQEPKFVKTQHVNRNISQIDTDLIVFNKKKNTIEVLGDLDNFYGAEAILENRVRLSLTNVEITAPNKDFGNRVIQNSITKIQNNIETIQGERVTRTGDYFGLDPNNSGSTEIDFMIDQQLLSTTNRNNVVTTLQNGTVPLTDDENLPRIQSNYSLGQSIGSDGGTEFVGQTFNPNRPPVGLNPDTKTLRQLTKAFAQTKTGKTLGYAWKAVDIGEVLISKAFQKAATAAAAAGAISLGTGVAALATLWATYEIGNLLFQAMRGIPDLYNVYERRNEILANGEYWEKQLVEETFWKDYGGELLEILQDAAKYSPSEILGDKIWGIALDNLTRQSQGESFPEIYEQDDSPLDTKDDIYYSRLPDEVKLQQMQNSIDYSKVLTGYYNARPEANVIMNRTYELANNVYNRDR